MSSLPKEIYSNGVGIGPLESGYHQKYIRADLFEKLEEALTEIEECGPDFGWGEAVTIASEALHG
jgi:hypothetical protein